jgi:hypothetical protein
MVLLGHPAHLLVLEMADQVAVGIQQFPAVLGVLVILQLHLHLKAIMVVTEPLAQRLDRALGAGVALDLLEIVRIQAL